jgi:hypothetical protein
MVPLGYARASAPDSMKTLSYHPSAHKSAPGRISPVQPKKKGKGSGKKRGSYGARPRSQKAIDCQGLNYRKCYYRHKEAKGFKPCQWYGPEAGCGWK